MNFAGQLLEKEKLIYFEHSSFPDMLQIEEDVAIQNQVDLFN